MPGREEETGAKVEQLRKGTQGPVRRRTSRSHQRSVRLQEGFPTSCGCGRRCQLLMRACKLESAPESSHPTSRQASPMLRKKKEKRKMDHVVTETATEGS